MVARVTKGKYHHVLLYLETQFLQIVNFTKLSTVQQDRLVFYLTVKVYMYAQGRIYWQLFFIYFWYAESILHTQILHIHVIV